MPYFVLVFIFFGFVIIGLISCLVILEVTNKPKGWIIGSISILTVTYFTLCNIAYLDSTSFHKYEIKEFISHKIDGVDVGIVEGELINLNRVLSKSLPDGTPVYKYCEKPAILFGECIYRYTDNIEEIANGRYKEEFVRNPSSN